VQFVASLRNFGKSAFAEGLGTSKNEELGMKLAGKVALISGAARGMGAHEARLFVAEGAKVVIGDVLDDLGRAVEEEINRAGGQAAYVHLDVTDEQHWRTAVETAVSRFGGLNILVNNAGVSGPGRVEDVTLEEWNRVMAINSTGVFLGTKTAIPAMRSAGGGSIVNISSQLGLVGADNSSPQYQSSKGAVRLLTKATAIQYAKENIRANSVHPGPIETPMTEVRHADPELRALTLSRIPLGRYGVADDVAKGVLYLACDDSSFVTGSELVIDGGWTAQ
jgi:cyclopentanol dehydrogenase